MNKHRLFHKGYPSVVKPVFDLNNKFSKRSPAQTFLMIFVRCLLCNRIWFNGLSGKSSNSLACNDANRLPGHFYTDLPGFGQLIKTILLFCSDL